jgi:ABC-type dipeptide/oligopeptide/nickel transport system permease component
VLTYVGRRLLAVIPTVWGVATAVFVIAHLLPGDIFRDANLATFPGLCILFAVLAFNLTGDGLRDALDPRLS